MKTRMIAQVLMVVVLLAVAGTAQAQGLIPDIKFGKNNDVKLNIKGFADASFTQDLSGGKSDLLWNNFRPRLTLSIKDHWEIGTVINFADFQEPNGNWLRELYVGYRFANEKWKLSVGRIFVAAGYSTPAPFELETVNYPFSDPFDAYAWGVGLEGKWGKDWSLRVSVSGASDSVFSDDESWRRLEFSTRIEKGLEQGKIAVTVQASKDFLRLGTDFTWKPVKQFYLRTGLAYVDNTDDQTSNKIGAYVIGVYRPAQWFEFHSQLDGAADIQKSYYEWQKVKSDDGSMALERVERFTSDETNVVWTNGVSVYVGKGNVFSFTVDYETAVDGEKPDRLLARARFRF